QVPQRRHVGGRGWPGAGALHLLLRGRRTVGARSLGGGSGARRLWRSQLGSPGEGHLMMRSVFRFVTCVAVGIASTASAQSSSVSLPARMGSDARAASERIIASARVAGLPMTPLADKAAEGVLKGADDQIIVIAVRTLARELGEARALIGSTRDAALLTAT